MSANRVAPPLLSNPFIASNIRRARKGKEMDLMDLVPLVLLLLIVAALSFYAKRYNRYWFIRGAILAAITVLFQVLTRLA
jgi:glucose-6-phosphate-specific signal transduction histidine kinase